MKLRLFAKITIVIVISLWITNLVTIVTASSIMEKMFVNAFTISNNKILDQIVSDFESFNVQNLAIINTYRQNTDLKQYFTSSTEINSQDLFKIFYKIRMNLKGIEKIAELPTLSVITLGPNGNTFTSGGDGLNVISEDLQKHPITEASKNSPFKLQYFYSTEGLAMYQKDFPCVIAAKQLMDPYTTRSFGTIYISISENDFSKMYSKFTEKGSTMMVMDPQGTIVSSNLKGLVGTKNSVLLGQAISVSDTERMYATREDENGKSVILAKYLPVYGMYLVNQVNLDVVLKSFAEIKPVIFGVCFLVTCMAMVCVFFITRKITKPLTKLVRHMEKIKNGHFEKIENAKASYEVKELQLVYNKMIDEMDSYVDSLVKEQNQRRKAELETLQMQINPHFLYNTLATIKYLSWQGNGQAVTSTINALIALLQNTINTTSEAITVSQEIENLKNYVTINQMRYGECIQVEYYVEEVCEGCKIPKLVLQPFLENAFFHAYQEKKEGIIRVFITKRKENICCEVLDDGDGMETHEVKEHFSGIGINNVNERIKLIYGSEYGVKITSKKGVGTTVNVTLPYEIWK
ncbi:MAG: sensor histidine kinase [Cellulosilyticaceae bacterium]